VSGFDLHTHTIFSDGTTTPEDNVRAAIACGLEGLGVTDHDTTEPFERASAAADGTGLELVLGTEFSAEHAGASVHLLGLWIDPAHADLADELRRLRGEREDRARRIVERFNALDVPISFERVVELAGGAPIGRPHIARAVVESGRAANIQEVFSEYLADGGPAYVPKHAVDPVRAVELLVAAGGVAVLAHPGLFGDRSGAQGIDAGLIEQMTGVGLAGLEADHPQHSDEQRRTYRALAAGLGLEVTAGSDHHGTVKAANPIGCATTPRAVVERLRAWRRA
jgi:3',5'-nucleoside bisphosphate phosphatase